MPVAILPVCLLLALFASSGRGCIPTRTPEYIVDQEMWQELQKQATTSVLLTTVKETTDSSTSPSSAAPTTTTTATSTTSSTTTTTTTTFYCPTMPTPWIYNPTNGHCYYSSTDRELMWQDAETNCRNLVTGARLASISDQDENDFIYNMLGMGDYYWIGLQQLMGTNTFSSTGSWIDNSMYDYVNGYSNWHTPPTMLMYDGCTGFYGPDGNFPRMWYGYDCTQTSTPFLYICEVPAT